MRDVAIHAVRAVPGGFAWRFDPLHRTSAPVPFRREMFDEFLARIAVPALLVFGENGFRLDDEADRAKRIPKHHIVELGGEGHMMHWTAPGALASALAGFFRESA